MSILRFMTWDHNFEIFVWKCSDLAIFMTIQFIRIEISHKIMTAALLTEQITV